MDFHRKGVWLPLAFLILLVLIYKKNWRGHYWSYWRSYWSLRCATSLPSHVCKPVFTRFRPTHHPDFMDQVKTVFGYRGGLYGFISSHAANAFGFATLMICGISCSAGQSFSGRLLLLIYGFILGFISFRISCREPFRVCSSVIWSTGSILSAVRSCFLCRWIMGNHCTRRNVSVSSSMQYMWRSWLLSFLMYRLRLVCKNDTCRKAYLFME